METGRATETGLGEETESAAVTTVTQGSSAWSASRATSTKRETTPSLSARVTFGPSASSVTRLNADPV